MGLVNARPVGYQCHMIQSPIPWLAATKAGVPDMCTSFFQGGIGDLEQDKGRGQGTCPQAFVVSEEDRSESSTGLDMQVAASLTCLLFQCYMWPLSPASQTELLTCGSGVQEIGSRNSQFS